MEKEELNNLFKKYHEGKCTEEEKALLEAWYLDFNEHELEITPKQIKIIGEKIFRELPGNENQFIKIGYKLLAAAVLIGATIAIATILIPAPSATIRQIVKSDIPPGSNAAILTLGNGQNINLTNAKSGLLVSQAGFKISKTNNGQITYERKKTVERAEQLTNKISIPAGGQWQVILPDGSKVWLNSSSSLSYPITFSNQKERVVLLTGEGYFEVAKDRFHPFVVRTSKQEVKVLGTHFNVNSYHDEPTVKTTLLEGHVSVTANQHARSIFPGEEAVLNGTVLSIQKANTEEAVAWKNGYFRFNDESILTIMRKLARWYNIDVTYEGNVATDGLNGRISRSKNISQVLAALEATKTVHFKIEGRRIIVSSK
jgi:transmembrane sensor